MGICKYCGKPAGFLKTKHKECEEKHKNGLSKIKTLITEAFRNNDNLKKLKMKFIKLQEIALSPLTS